MRVTPTDLNAAAAVIALAVAAAVALVYRAHLYRGTHVLGRPTFDGDEGAWPATGPRALLLDGLPAIDWHAAPPPDMAENHADFFGVPAPKYTERDAWRGEADAAAERLATTDTRSMLAAIVLGLEFYDTIDPWAGTIMERVYAELSLIDISADLS